MPADGGAFAPQATCAGAGLGLTVPVTWPAAEVGEGLPDADELGLAEELEPLRVLIPITARAMASTDPIAVSTIVLRLRADAIRSAWRRSASFAR